MNPVVKRIGQVVVGFGLLFATALAFQNCSGYQVYDSSSQSNLASTCMNPNCGSQSVQGLNLLLTNTYMEVLDAQLPAAPNRVIDVGGFCDDAEFSNSEIQYQFVLGTSALGPWQKTGVNCDNLGRFQIRATVPTTKATYSLYVALSIPLGSGQYLFSPAAQKFFTINIK